MQAKQLSKEQLLAQIEEFKQDLAQVNEEKKDLETLLDSITEHSTHLENEIHHKNKEMLNYIHQVEKLTTAAIAVENNAFKPESLESVAARSDELGCLARVFAQMVQTIKTREQELASAKVQLEAILNTVPGSISWIDSQGVYISVNRHLAQQWKLPQEAFMGQEVGFLKGSTQFAEFIRQFLANPEESTSQVIEVPVRDGVRYYLIAAQKYEQGTGTVSVGIDITAHKQVEEALRIAEENYRSIYENALEGIFQSTPEGKYISVNPAMARIYGYDSPKDMVAIVTKISEQIYVDPTVRYEFQRLMEEQGEVKGFEYQAFQSDRNIIWVEENTRAVQDSSGKLLYYEGIIQNITDRKRKEAELQRQLAELQVEIDQQKREREVAKITQSDYFKDLQAEAKHFQVDEFWS